MLSIFYTNLLADLEALSDSRLLIDFDFESLMLSWIIIDFASSMLSCKTKL